MEFAAMPNYDLFVSHAWDYDERYIGICRLLDSQVSSSFSWRDYSAPKSHPIVDPGTEVGRNTLRALLRERVRQCTCFILVSGMFVYHRYWVQAEIDFARQYGKPILGIQRRGQQRTPEYVVQVSDEVVAWYGPSIVGGIKRVVGW